ncbi:type I restriction enzyme, S subunit [Polaribacter sp. KT25b]|uniref:restriction endonuclease subunit S n=1 Tax=Polaribacter sp. KT25b TaxID=1855336 RepID=UPI00087AD117|nr:restriction endonuclease subunit S [Polaribacter sp. KT25b]SDS17538.1 type I restriction enzyme, S subunit [Polaribacter sp. KT25b]
MSSVDEKMPEGWVKDTLGEVIDIKHGFAFKGEFITLQSNNKILITPGNFKVGGGFKSNKFKYYTGDYPENYVLKPNDVIVTMTDLSKEGDTLGFSAKVPNDEKEYLHNQRIGLIQFKNSDFDKEYVYWLLRTKHYQKSIVNSATGSTVRHTSPSRIQEYQFKYPEDKKEQKAIANVLTAFDDKIENLRAQNQTLEQTAQTIFKEWFGLYQIDDVLPEGWRVGKLGEIGTIVCGKTPSKSKSDYYGDDIPFIKIPDMHNQVFILGANDNLTLMGANSQRKKMIPKNSIIVSCIATVGLVSLSTQDCQTNQQINSVIPINEFMREYLYLKLTSLRKYLNDLGSGGTATLNVNTSTFSNIELVIPAKDFLMKFNKIQSPLFEKILSNLKQIQTLTQTRDTLLPKLMRGELRVNGLKKE